MRRLGPGTTQGDSLVHIFGHSSVNAHARNGRSTTGGSRPPHAPERLARTRVARGAGQLLTEARAARVSRCTSADVLRCLVVALYLAGVMAWLLLSRQIRPNFSVRRTLRALLFRQRSLTPLSGIVHDHGHCYKAGVDPALLSDAESMSRVQVYENGVPLPRGHCPHDAIRQQGGGTFSHWAGAIYFSARDNSDPRGNGRRYSFKEV